MTDKPSIDARVSGLTAEQMQLLARRLGATSDSQTQGEKGRTRLVGFVTMRPERNTPSVNPCGRLRDYLAEHLPDYMVPGDLHVLNALPLQPNGKVDRQALRSTRTQAGATESESVRQPAGEFENNMLAIWAKVLQTEDIAMNDDFFELGGDSILSINVVSRARQHGIDLKPGDLFDFPTIAQLSAYFADENSQASATADTCDDSPLRSKNAAGSLNPFFMIHGGSRLLSQLKSNLNAEQPVHLFPAHWESGDIDISVTMNELAAQCLQILKTIQPEGPYAIGGYSIGCIIGLEVAQLLRRAGEQVDMLFMLDPPEDPAFFKKVHVDAESLKRSADGPARIRERTNEIGRLPLSELPGYVLGKLRGHFGHYLLRLSLVPRYWYALGCRRFGRPIPESIRKLYVSKVYLRACRKYEIQPYDSPLLVFRGTQGTRRHGDALWRAVALGDIRIDEYPCHHLDLQRDSDMVEQWTQRLAEHMQTLCVGKAMPSTRKL